MSFNIDESKIPEVVFIESWKLEDGGTYEIYQASDWDFEYFEDDNIDHVEFAKKAIYAWIAWLNWLESREQD